MNLGAHGAYLEVVPRRVNAVCEQRHDHVGVGIHPEARPRKAKVPKRIGSHVFSRTRPSFAFPVEACEQSAARTPRNEPTSFIGSCLIQKHAAKAQHPLDGSKEARVTRRAKPGKHPRVFVVDFAAHDTTTPRHPFGLRHTMFRKNAATRKRCRCSQERFKPKGSDHKFVHCIPHVLDPHVASKRRPDEDVPEIAVNGSKPLFGNRPQGIVSTQRCRTTKRFLHRHPTPKPLPKRGVRSKPGAMAEQKFERCPLALRTSYLREKRAEWRLASHPRPRDRKSGHRLGHTRKVKEEVVPPRFEMKGTRHEHPDATRRVGCSAFANHIVSHIGWMPWRVFDPLDTKVIHFSRRSMPEFVWEAKGRGGEVKRGVMEADTEAAVTAKLRQQNLTPSKVKKKGALFEFQFGTGVGTKDLVTFTRLFATMIDAGLPIVQCLDILSGQTDNKHFAAVLRDIKGSVEQGATFSESLARHPKVFDPLYVNLVQAGELGGILDTILARLAVYIEKAMKLKRQVKGAMVYPSSVLVVFVLVLCVLLGWVIPSFETMFKDFGSKDELPYLTQLVMKASNLMISYSLWVILGAIALGVAIRLIYKRPAGKRWFHRLFLRLPIMGPVLRKIAVARFTRTLGTLLASGVPILDALDIVARTAGNMVVEEAILFARLKISEGKNMAEPLLQTNVFPPMVVQMVGVGEQTGALDAMLNKIADFYEEEVDVAVASLTSLIEPAMMVGIGGTVGVVLIAMYLPIFSIAGKIKPE